MNRPGCTLISHTNVVVAEKCLNIHGGLNPAPHYCIGDALPLSYEDLTDSPSQPLTPESPWHVAGSQPGLLHYACWDERKSEP